MNGLKKTILIVAVVVVVLVVGIIMISVLFAKSKQISVGKTANIKSENIEITVLSSEKTTVNDEYGILAETGDLIKVQVKIKNNGSTDYSWNNYTSFKLGDKIVSFFEHGDDLPNEIAAGSTETGYLYFEYTDDTIMEYTTAYSADSSTSAKATKYYFKIK